MARAYTRGTAAATRRASCTRRKEMTPNVIRLAVIIALARENREKRWNARGRSLPTTALPMAASALDAGTGESSCSGATTVGA
jgi:hypothetical protein